MSKITALVVLVVVVLVVGVDVDCRMSSTMQASQSDIDKAELYLTNGGKL